MKKRLRKKLRLREFQEIGFHTDFSLSAPSTEAEFAFWDKLIAFVEKQRLEIGGGINSFYATRVGRGTATDVDRKELRAWLQQQPEVSVVKVWPLDDAWHGPFKWL
jgi:uncharacterized protein YggL (DUF469 family)